MDLRLWPESNQTNQSWQTGKTRQGRFALNLVQMCTDRALLVAPVASRSDETPRSKFLKYPSDRHSALRSPNCVIPAILQPLHDIAVRPLPTVATLNNSKPSLPPRTAPVPSSERSAICSPNGSSSMAAVGSWAHRNASSVRPFHLILTWLCFSFGKLRFKIKPPKPIDSPGLTMYTALCCAVYAQAGKDAGERRVSKYRILFKTQMTSSTHHLTACASHVRRRCRWW